MNLWKHSSLRFYILNASWNYRFWFFAKKIYRTISYDVDDTGFRLDIVMKMSQRKRQVSKKIFAGYLYKGKMYLDNPGLQGIDRDTWVAWRKKNLIV